MKTQPFTALMLTLFLFSGCDFGTPSWGGNDVDYSRSDRYASMVSAETSQANTDFALRLFSRLTDGRNVFISPISVSLALAMAMNGASGENFDEMRRVLGYDGWDLESINEQFLAILESAPTMDNDVNLYLADSLWAKDEFAPRLLESFKKNLSGFYLAEPFTLDFSDPAAPGTINAWVSDHTGGRINDLIGSIKPEVIMYLINAIYFKGAWTTAFDQERTSRGTFTLSDSSQVACDFMSYKDNQTLAFYEDEEYDSVRLPYGRGMAALYAFAPKRKSLRDFAASLTVDTLDAMITAMREREVPVCFPKFTCEYDASLVDALQALGMERAFVEGGFLNLAMDAQNIFVSDVKHRSFIEVNEVGTEAAAATSVEFSETSMPPAFEGDRPFIYLIRDDRNGTILFMGAMEDPAA